MKCPKCQFENPAGMKFCGECGHNVAHTAKVPPFEYQQPHSYTPKHLGDKILTIRTPIEGERKLVTVMLEHLACNLGRMERVRYQI